MESASPHRTIAPVSQGPTWGDIARTLRIAEEGRAGAADVELRPGGTLVLTTRQRPAQPLSQLPKERMAASSVCPSTHDVEVLQRLDPDNREEWTPVREGRITGWVFRMTPPFPGQPAFVFFAFRSPADRNTYRVAVLDPDMDQECGHTPHMIRTHVGGERVPVICGPSGRPASDLGEVRTQAAKWMAYTSARLAGRNPGFSQ